MTFREDSYVSFPTNTIKIIWGQNVYLELDGLQLKVGEGPLVEEDLLQDAEEVLAAEEAGVVLLEVGNEVV